MAVHNQQRRGTATFGLLADVAQNLLNETLKAATLRTSSPDLKHVIRNSSSQFSSPSSPKTVVGTGTATACSRSSAANWCNIPLHYLDPNRETILCAVQRQVRAREGILDSYRRVKDAFKQLQDGYVASKDSFNVVQRYTEMKRMVQRVVSLEENYWILIDLPKQGISETQADFLTRVLAAMDQRLHETPASKPTGIGSILGSTPHFTERAKDVGLLEQLKSKSTDELRKENAQMQTYLCKLIKKYANLRALVSQLKHEYDASKGYPIIPRYTMLKRMIKATLRAPAFVEVAHELDDTA